MDALAASNPVLGNYSSALNYGCKSTQTCRSINIRHSQNLHYCDLSWSTGSRFINLQQGLINRYSSQLLACSPSQKDCLNLRAFTESQEALVKETWGILKKDAGRHAVNLFLRVFEIAPSTKRLFSFLKDSDVPLEKNPQLKSHALTVFVIICEASTSLRNEGKVLTPGSTMKKMAQAHGLSGVVDEHYDVVKFCLLKTIEEGLPEGKWNSEVREAWVEAYDELVAAIKAEDIAAA